MRKYQRHTQAEMLSHFEACKDSNLPQVKYCKQKGLAYSTFQYWAKKYREESSKDEISDNAPGFISVKIHPDPETAQVRMPKQLHFLYPNGIQLMCSETITHEALKNLLNP
jgi:hypothetical protein